MGLKFAGPGVNPSLGGLVSNQMSLQSGQMWLIQPAGWYEIITGPYTFIQEYEPITGIWRGIGGGMVGTGQPMRLYSDGVNYRLANLTGCPVGALITNAGTGYTSAPTVTAASSGSSIWRAIVGGAVSTTVTVTNGGLNYTYEPDVLISAPPVGGIQATAICTLSAGAVSTVTIINQGAGYTAPPTITFVNDPREGVNGTTVGYNAAAVTTLAGAGTITGLLCIDPGNGGVTSIPTLVFSGGGGASAAATVIMCWTITGYTVTTAGTGMLPVGGFAYLTGIDAFPTTAPIYTNPETQRNLVKTRLATIAAAITTSGALTTVGAVVYDGGIYTSVPTPVMLSSSVTAYTGPPTPAFTVGGTTDTSTILTT